MLACAETWSEGTAELRAFETFNRPRVMTASPRHRGLVQRVWESNGPIWLADLSREVGMLRAGAALTAGLRTAFAFPILIGDSLYGVMEFSVARRGRELAVRMALGADASSLRTMVLGEGMRVATIGVVLGLAGALAVSRGLEQLLYEVQPHDPATMTIAAVLFLAIAATATVLPARRATRVNPAVTLRSD